MKKNTALLCLLFLVVFFAGVAYTPREIRPPLQYPSSVTGISYHNIECYHVRGILPGNLVYFATRDAAEAAGKSPCFDCKPHITIPGP